ncbi:Deoxyguanosinetriphosphate triphosphohydrolase [Anatilimnocola aggregata]|uniref:Deoxyguanosinetriphosphate triphosphohydrolase-like protein n=1 Tax=Anatilimnocola aggregata TaxID=2528021 RepID=A0A517YHW9_9BACT|nr:dNTP triphosphohydrolase [Anatilimnocola aggregata]QDU29802.1 Deoxyguanosinetriphosphate triphosphohydrolase [Anatilimnocola aggregata]
MNTLPDLSNLICTVDERERALFASYAMFSRQSKGRKHPQPEHPYRGPFQRDRDRVIHSAAFRRLSGKMQVFTGDFGDYHRTRLTHTHEVSCLARTLGRCLRLNEDLVEALALFHDIGHPPFGHAGEDALNEVLHEYGGFSHNRFALTIAEDLEQRYAEFSGLNLTYELLEGQQTRAEKAALFAATGGCGPLLEVQVVEAADSMTYDAHDSDDAVKLGLVTLEELQQTTLVREAVASAHRRFANCSGDRLRKAVVHELIERQVSNVLQYSGEILRECRGLSSDEARRLDFRIGPSPELAELKRELERFLYERVYRHARLITMRREAQAKLQQAFQGYLAKPDLLPPHHFRRIERVGAPRAVGDYLAGMTDRFFLSIFEQHFAQG